MEAALASAQLLTLACEMCDNSSPSVIACVECQKRLCAPCQRVHDQVAGTNYHNLIVMTTSNIQATGEEAKGRPATGLHSRATNKNVCKTHANQELAFHCCPCDVLICPACRETTHQGHDTEDLNMAFERIREHVRGLLRLLEVNVKAVTEVITEVTRTEQDLERQRQAVVSEAVEAARKVSAWANQAEDNLVKEVNKMADPVKEELLKRKTAAREVNAYLFLLQDRAKVVTKTGSYAELQSLRSDLERSLVSDATQSLGKGQDEFNRLAVTDNVNSTGFCVPDGIKTKGTLFFERRSSGQEILQSTVPKYVGEVTPAPVEDVGKTTAWTFYGWPFDTFCSDINGEGFTLVRYSQYDSYYRDAHWRQQNHFEMTKFDMKGPERSFSFSGFHGFRYRLMQPWPNGWLIVSDSKMQVLKDTEQYINEDTGYLTGPLAYCQGVLSNSSPNGHVYSIWIDSNSRRSKGSNCVHDIKQISLDPDGNISVKPFFQVVNRDIELVGFDVSAEEEYFAVSSIEGGDSGPFNLKVVVYRRLKAEPFASVIIPVNPKPAAHTALNSSAGRTAHQTEEKRSVDSGHICFSMYQGKEMLRLAVCQEDIVYVIDHRKGCKVVNHMDIYKPVSLRRDCREKVWVGLADHTILAFET